MNLLYKEAVGKSISFLLIVFVIAVTGCAGHKATVVDINPRMETKEVIFARPLVVPPEYEVTDKKDPAQLIKKGINQSEKNRPGYAAEFFQMVVPTPSPDKGLKLSALFATANEHLRAGNIRAFRLTMEEIDGSLDKFQRASLSVQESTLIALYDLTQGKPYSPGIHPEETRELFERVKEE